MQKGVPGRRAPECRDSELKERQDPEHRGLGWGAGWLLEAEKEGEMDCRTKDLNASGDFGWSWH